MSPTEAEYRQLAAFRSELRQFLHVSEQLCAGVGLTMAQYQLLLAVRAAGEEEGPTIGSLADALLLRPHSAGELVDRAETAGIVARRPDGRDRRVVRVTLTERGVEVLDALAAQHLAVLQQSAMGRSMFDGDGRSAGAGGDGG